MRRFSIPALFLAFAALAHAADANFVRIWPQWRNADAFDRIGEYFGQDENQGQEIALRTQPAERAGMYFLVRVQASEPLANARFVLEIIRPDAPDAKTFTFPATLPRKNQVVHLGLTGQDWPGGRDTHPVAWKLSLQDSTGKIVTSQQSFLWAMPAK